MECTPRFKLRSMNTSNIRKLVRASATYDLLVTAPFATPWTFAIAHGHLSALNEALGGPHERRRIWLAKVRPNFSAHSLTV